MEFIKNPWNELFLDLVKNSKNSIKITSPYVKDNVVTNLLETKKDDVSLSLITSFKLMNYYTGASDLSALESILTQKGVVSNFQRLHSKIYIFDEATAIISSGNLTNGGLFNNYEYGVLINDNSVKKIVNDYNELLNHDLTGCVTSLEINQAKEILSKVPKSQPITLPKIEIQKSNEDIEIFTGGIESITSTLKGWKLEVFICLLKINKPSFTLEDINSFLPYFENKFPDNNNIEAKIRQQLQLLRDIGLVEFLGKGNYRKLWI